MAVRKKRRCQCGNVARWQWHVTPGSGSDNARADTRDVDQDDTATIGEVGLSSVVMIAGTTVATQPHSHTQPHTAKQ
jgi:hypothetical protein